MIPVIAVLSGERSLRCFFELFAFSWLGNLVGAAIIGALLFVPNALGEPILVRYQAYAAHKLALPLPGW